MEKLICNSKSRWIKDLADFIQKDDSVTMDKFYWLSSDLSNLNTGGINNLDSNLYTNSTTVNNGLSNMDIVLKLFDKNSLDSMVKLLSTFLPTTKTEGQESVVLLQFLVCNKCLVMPEFSYSATRKLLKSGC